VLVEECGAVLLPAPLFSTFVATPPGVESFLRQHGVVRERRLTLAWAEKERGFALTDALSAGSTVVTDATITGGKTLVVDAAKVSGFVIVAHDHDGPQMVYVDASDVRVYPHSTLDGSRPLADIELVAASALPLIPSADVAGVVASMEQRACALAAAEALGVGRSALDLGLTHARERSQFGKPIGAYQAVSHRLVDAYAELELARSLTYWAVHCLQAVDDDRDFTNEPWPYSPTWLASDACTKTSPMQFFLEASNLQRVGRAQYDHRLRPTLRRRYGRRVQMCSRALLAVSVADRAEGVRLKQGAIARQRGECVGGDVVDDTGIAHDAGACGGAKGPLA
jgi:alkylation response protein AidB-like acyl-CoA dehydrogenase